MEFNWLNLQGKTEHHNSNSIPRPSSNCKFTETEVIRLKRILHDPKRKTRYKIIARQLGVTEMQLHRIKTGENWGHIKI